MQVEVYDSSLIQTKSPLGNPTQSHCRDRKCMQDGIGSINLCRITVQVLTNINFCVFPVELPPSSYWTLREECTCNSEKSPCMRTKSFYILHSKLYLKLLQVKSYLSWRPRRFDVLALAERIVVSLFLPFIPDKETSQEVKSLGNQLVMGIVGAMSSAASPHRSVVCVCGGCVVWGGNYIPNF